MLQTPDAMRSHAQPRFRFPPLTPERKRTLAIVCVVWIGTATLFALPYLSQAQAMRWGIVFSHYAVAGISMAVSLPLLLTIAGTARLARWSAIALSTLAVLATSAALSSVDIIVFDRIVAWFGEASLAGSYRTRWISNFAVFTSQMALIATAFWTLETLALNRRRLLQLEEIKTAHAQVQAAANAARLSALRYQLNPHFLFNTLNSISSLVMTGRKEQAEEMLAQLSDFLRRTLVAGADEQQTLERELETIDSYLAIERVRFGDRLAVEIACPPSLREAAMPGFLLQPLVENAIKYGVAESDRQVTIRIEAMAECEDLVVVVEDDGAPIARKDGSGTGGTGIGLRNVAERLEALYGTRGRVETARRERGFLSIVRLPLALDDAR